MNSSTRHIRWKQKFVVGSAVGVCIAFGLLPLGALFGEMVPGVYLLWTAVAALFLAVAAYAVLASAKCPHCSEAFIGNTVPESGGPSPEPFAVQCRYCGHPL